MLVLKKTGEEEVRFDAKDSKYFDVSLPALKIDKPCAQKRGQP